MIMDTIYMMLSMAVVGCVALLTLAALGVFNNKEEEGR
jgi:hypothetical protein